ncbi:MAG: phosphatase PAP2 family protein [Candidatus Omnitrophica bacterium]|nr:phosphatase PAP2 family protein [Candidatus Omnitrophota bacterium]
MPSLRRLAAIGIQVAAFLGVYYIDAAVAAFRNVQLPWMAVSADRYIPFVPEFVWVYVSAYVLNTLGLFLVSGYLDKKEFKLAVKVYSTSLVLFALCHLGFPRMAVRPDVDSTMSLSAMVLSYLQGLTTSYNTFPSAHVSYSLITGWLAAKSFSKNRLLSSVIIVDTIAIVASVLLVKEHTIMDAVGGAIVAAASISLAKAMHKQ